MTDGYYCVSSKSISQVLCSFVSYSIPSQIKCGECLNKRALRRKEKTTEGLINTALIRRALAKCCAPA